MTSPPAPPTSPTVSVLVTCYNLGRYLDEAIDSVFSQTFQDFEIVIVDDGSTEPETIRMLQGYQRARTRVVRIDNRGLPGARNEAARHTTGRYLCALDADDKLEATWFEKAVAFLEANPEIAFVSHWLRAFGDEDWDWTPDRCDLEALLTRNTINGAALVRREAFLDVGGFDESMTLGCEDWDLWLTMVERGFPGAIIPEILFFYRRRHDSMSQEMLRGETHLQLVETLMRKHAASFRRHLDVLLLEKEVEIARMRGEMQDRLLEDDTWLLPEVTRRRQQLVRLRAKAGRLNEELEHRVEREHNEPARSEGALQQGLDRLRDEQRRLEQERNELAATAGRLHSEIRALHASASWKVTGPARTIAGWFRKSGGD